MKKLLLLTITLLAIALLAACGNTAQQSGATSIPSRVEPSTPAGPEGSAEASAPSVSGEGSSADESTSQPAFQQSMDGSSGTEDVKILVAYFSWSGNTRSVAEKIQQELGADLFEIATTGGYSDDYNTVLDEAKAEQANNARPELSAQVENLEQYDVIFLGYPNWWGDMPMALYSFLDIYDLSGKTVVPFVTSGGSGFSNTLSSIQEAEPDAKLLEGLSLSGSSAEGAGDEIAAWLSGLDLK